MRKLATTLSSEDIFTLAERESGAYGLADENLKQRFSGVIDTINEAGPYTADQVDAMHRQIQGILTNRLRIALDRTSYPGIGAEKIEKPIFVVGFGRSGTTFLHSLLAQDPEVLSPTAWHSIVPSPPPGATAVCDGRIAFARRAVERWIDFCPAQLIMHPYADKLEQQPIEDEEIFTLDFRNLYSNHYYKVPTLGVMNIQLLDVVEALQFHREVLQHFQWNTGKTRWTCKQPTALMHLKSLFEVYPDAVCVWTHRPWSEIYASLVAISSAIFDTINCTPNDWVAKAAILLEGMKKSIDNLLADEIVDDPRIVHVRFNDLTADPMGVIERVYAARGWDVSQDFRQAVDRWIGDPANSVDRYGRYPYSYSAFGLDEAWVRELFAGYNARFGLSEKTA